MPRKTRNTHTTNEDRPVVRVAALPQNLDHALAVAGAPVVVVEAAVAARHGLAPLAADHRVHLALALGVAVIPARGAAELGLVASLASLLAGLGCTSTSTGHVVRIMATACERFRRDLWIHTNTTAVLAARDKHGLVIS